MIELGKQIVRLNDLAPGGQRWSRYGWAIRYDEGVVLYHALTSATLTLSKAKANSWAFTGREIAHLKKAGIIRNDSQDDDRQTSTIRQQVARPKPIRTLFLILTDQCNLRCPHCYEDLERYSRYRSMSPETARTAIRRFVAECPRASSIFFYGGEPFLKESLIRELIEFVHGNFGGKNISLEVITNGTIYRPDTAEFLARHRVGIAVSLDGPEAVTNRMRVAKSARLNVFQQATQLIAACQQAGVEPSLLCTITEQNAPVLADVTAFFLNTLQATNLTYNLQIRQPNRQISDDRPYWHQLGQRMAMAYFQLLDRGIIEARTLRYLSGFTEGRYSISECDAGYGTQIVVDPDGRVGPCQGYLFNPTFFVESDHWGDLPSHPLWKQFVDATPINIPVCHDCPFLATCGGGCYYNRIAPDQPNPNFCQYLRSLLYCTIERVAFSPKGGSREADHQEGEASVPDPGRAGQ